MQTWLVNVSTWNAHSQILTDWIDMVNAWKHPKHKVKVALVGKYVSLHDAYISVVEALKHGAVANNAEVEIKWVDSELVSDYNVDSFFSDVDGIIVPGGFGDRGIEGMSLLYPLCP